MKQYKKEIILSPVNLFIVQKGEEMIKLRKGMTQVQVKKVLGEPSSINQGNNPKNLKFMFKFSGNGFSVERYELLFREDFLEWSIKIK